MTTPPRSPILGYNHNLKYRGRVFHVQTEDSGPGHPRIFTHLYFGGSIVASKKHEYDAEAPADIVRGLMQSQHKSILRDLKNGRHDAQLEQFFAKRGEKLDAPDDSAEMPALATEARPALVAADPPAAIISAASNETPTTARHTDSVSPEVLAQFEHAFDDEPSVVDGTAPQAGQQAQPTIPVRPIPAAPAPASPSVRIERTVPVGQVSPTAVAPAPMRPRKPGHSIPYVVQQGSHPVAPAEGEQEVHVPTLTMPAAPIIPRTKRPTEPGAVAKAEAARADAASKGNKAPVAAAATMPPTPAAPLDPAAASQTAPITAATVGALPTEVVSREDNQSLDEVIMAYLARGVEDEHKNVG